MAYSNFYETGTVTVSAGGTALTGIGTEWVTAGVVPGAAVFVAGHSLPLLVRSVTSETTIVLDMPAPQAATGADYVMLTLAYDAPMVELLRRLLNQQARAFDLDGEDKSLTLTTDAGTVETVYATETSGEGRFRFGLIDGDLDTFRVQRWANGAWADVFTVARSTGVTTWDGSPDVEATYLEGLVASAEAAETAAAASAVAADTSADASSASATSSATSAATATMQATAASTSASAAATDRALVQSAMESIAAVSVPALPWLIDGLPPSVLLLAGSGAMMLAGGYVDVTDILTFSSAAKRVEGFDGTLYLSPANQPAYNWRTVGGGRVREILIEPAAATNLVPKSEAGSAADWYMWDTELSHVENGLGQGVRLYTVTGGGLYGGGVEPWWDGAVSPGDVRTFSARLLAGNSTSTRVGIYGSVTAFGGEAGSSLVILSGPGVATHESDGPWLISGLSQTVPTHVALTRTALQSETFSGVLYPASAGASYRVGTVQVEAGPLATSYIPTSGAAATRIPDDARLTTAALAQVTGAGGCTIALAGAVTSTGIIMADGNNNKPFHDFSAAGGYSDSVQISASGASTAFGAVIAIGPSGSLAAINGVMGGARGATTSLVGPVRIGAFVNGAWGPSQLYLRSLRVYPYIASDAGLQAASEV